MFINVNDPEFKALSDQKQPLSRLAAILQKGAMPHAFLFTGIEGVGKGTAAVLFAMAANCAAKKESPPEDTILHIDRTETAPNQISESISDGVRPVFLAGISAYDPCYCCRSCKKINAATHPDIITIQASGAFIKIAQIRDLCSRLTIKPNEAMFRVVIIKNAHKMNSEASNALLKILEEPPQRTIFILTATQPNELLPTVVSRCQQIRFHPLSRETVKQILSADNFIGPELGYALAAMAGGSLTRALEMTNAEWMGKRNWLIETLEALPEMPVDFQLAFAEKLSKNKNKVNEILEILKNWLRDTLVFRYKPEKIINSDLIDKISRTDQNRNISVLISQIEAIRSAQRKLKANTNLRLTLEVLVMELAKN